MESFRVARGAADAPDAAGFGARSSESLVCRLIRLKSGGDAEESFTGAAPCDPRAQSPDRRGSGEEPRIDSAERSEPRDGRAIRDGCSIRNGCSTD
ncbi:MAG: hypothetical protein GX621_09365 [Pirellulaceae bacterium]|nr:hypothetical protein [Pirellulaceae bacterium]